MDSCVFPTDDPIEEWYSQQWWIGTSGNEDVCYCGLKRLSGGIVYMTRAGVVSEFRGNGFQKRMIKKRIQWARDNGAFQVITYTAHGNVASTNSLISCGFKQYMPQYPWAGEDVIYWFKDIK